MRFLRWLYRLILLILTIGAAGVLVAAVAFPFAAATGIAAREAAAAIDAMAPLVEPPLPQRSQILAADGTSIADVYLENRSVVPFDQVPVLVRDAFLAIEDTRFYEHNGVDHRAIMRAALENQRSGEIRQGASTLTQQYVKNVLLFNAGADDTTAIDQSLARKLREAQLALELETRLDKDTIFGRYLNIAYFGAGAYGVNTAAQRFFGKPVSDVDLREAALLAGLVQSPSRYDPIRHPAAALKRRNTVLARMATLNMISNDELAWGLASPIVLNETTVPNGCEPSFAAFYCDWVRRTLENDPAFGATPEERRAHLYSGGLRVRTTLDPVMQLRAQEAVDSQLSRDDRVATAAVIVEPGTGHVKAMAINRTFGTEPGETEVALATRAYQTGSIFKIFTLVEALEQGIPLSFTLPAPGRYTSSTLQNPPQGYFSNSGDASAGLLSLEAATWRSSNTFYVQLQERLGVLAIADMAERLGVTSLPREGSRAVRQDEGSFTLGAREVSPLEMANAYATLAARGVACRPTGIIEIIGAAGINEAVPDPRCHRALATSVADTATNVLTGVVTSGTGKAADIGRPVAGKTGTTQGYGSAWFIGYTPQLATAVWVGDPRGPSFPLLNVAGDARVFGGGLPARIWSKVMVAAHTDVSPVSFPPVDLSFTAVGPTQVPELAGLSPERAVAVLAEVGLLANLAPTTSPPAVPIGVVTGSVPAAGTAVDPGAQVQLLVTAAG